VVGSAFRVEAVVEGAFLFDGPHACCLLLLLDACSRPGWL
jgi:hypothetical protein